MINFFAKKDTPRLILNAAVTGDVEKVRKLLAKNDCPLDAPELITSMRSACANNNVELAALLLDYGIGSDAEIQPDWTFLNQAVEEMSADVIKLLIERGADVNRKDRFGQTALHQAIDIEIQAAINSDEQVTGEIVKFLIESGADINAKTNNGETPLDWAIRTGNESARQLLLEFQKPD